MTIMEPSREIAKIILCLICTSCIEAAEAQSAKPPNIPLCPGLTIVTAVHQRDGDYESIKTIESVSPKEARLKYSAEVMSGGVMGLSPPTLKKVTLHRTMLVNDLQSAKAYEQTYLENADETIPGTTAIGTSSAVLSGLKSKGEADLSISNAYGGLQLSGDKTKHPNYYDYLQVAKLRRADAEPVRLPVIVDDKLVELPAIRAEGDSFGDKVEFHFLDDERNPITLAFRIGIGGIKPLTPDAASVCKSTKGTANPMMLAGGRCDMPNGGDRDILRVIKISSRCTGPAAEPGGGSGEAGNVGVGGRTGAGGANGLEKALAQQGKVDVYSIYFSFNSDVIREESQATLNEIAEVMRRHPYWKLRIDGHTDTIGGDSYNLGLSNRRSAAVKNALVKQYNIESGRLTTGGYGASRPKATNDTLEGRAQNRRVELVKTG
jgi:outer membrane protein OmpA-like peptidoglycan-associated protein